MKARADAKRRDPGLQTDDLIMVSAKVYPGKEPYHKYALVSTVPSFLEKLVDRTPLK